MRSALPKGIEDPRTGLCPDAPNAPGILFSLIIPLFLNWDFLLFHMESIELFQSLHKPAASEMNTPTRMFLHKFYLPCCNDERHTAGFAAVQLKVFPL